MDVDYRRFFDAGFDVMCVVNTTHFIEINAVMSKLLGYSREELLSRPYLDFIHHSDKAVSAGAFNKPDPATFENRYISKSGKVLWFRWTRHPEPQDGVVYCVGEDITQLKVIERDLGKYLIDLRQAKEEAEQFAYAASHDLQEPLRTISNYVTFVVEDFGPILPEEGKEYLDYIVKAAKHGRALVSDLLALSRLGRSSQFTWANMDDVVTRVTSNLEFQIKDTEATIRSSFLPVVWGEPVLLSLLLQNLISNAIKFCGTDPPVVDIGYSEKEAETEFWVKDNGIGIDPQYADQVFAIFKRLDKSKEGTGIGLSVCRKIVDLHRGKIWIESTLGSGTTVHFVIPRPIAVTDDNENDSVGGGSHPGRKGSEADATAGGEAAVRNVRGERRRGGVVVLAKDGALRSSPASRFNLARLKST